MDSRQKKSIFETLPEGSLVKNKCINLRKAFFLKSESEKGCNQIEKLLNGDCNPSRLESSFLDSQFGWGLGVLAAAGNSNALKNNIRKILPTADEPIIEKEHDYVVDTYSALPHNRR